MNTPALKQSKSSGFSAVGAALIGVLLLTACAALPDKPVRAVTYDFGPGAVAASAVQTSNASQALPPIALAEIESSPALNSSGVLYRLMYFNSQELRPYAQARWSMPPAQLLRQRLRSVRLQSRGGRSFRLEPRQVIPLQP